MSVRRSCSYGDNPGPDSPSWGSQDLLQDSVLGLGRAVLSQPGGGEARWTQLGLCTPICRPGKASNQFPGVTVMLVYTRCGGLHL